MSEPLNRSTFPRASARVLLPTIETVELEQEQTLEAWANAPHETVPLQMVYDRRDPIYRRYLEHPTWRISLDVVGLLTAALLRYSPDSN